MKTSSSALFSLFLVLPVPSGAAPAAPPETEATTRLPSVTVIAPPGDDALRVVIDPRAPAQPIPAQDGAEVLRAIPGFNVIRKGGTDGDPVLRGMAGSRLGILLDGTNLLGGCDNRMDPPTAYIFPASYSAVQVLKGPQSVLDGPGNSAGVVRFERTVTHFHDPGAQGEAALTFGSFGRHDQRFALQAGMHPVDVELTANRTSAGDFHDGDGRALPSAYTRWNLQAAAGWTPDFRTRIEFTGGLSDGEAAYADRSMDGAGFARRSFGARVERHDLSPVVASVTFNLYTNRVDHVMDNFSVRSFTPTAMMPNPTAANPERYTVGGRAVANLTPAPSLAVAVGVDFQGNRHRSRSSANALVIPYQTLPRRLDAEFSSAGVFAEGTWRPAEAQRLVAGLRFDDWRADDHRPTVSLGMSGTAANPTFGAVRRSVLPSGFARLERDLQETTTLSLGVGHSARFPDYWELIGKESAGTASAFQTRTERTTQLDAGLTHRANRLAATLSLFANQVDDYILVESGVAKPAGMMGMRSATIVRSIRASARGGEANVAYHISPRWRADAAVAVVHGDNLTDDRPLAQEPPFEGRLGLAYSARNWSVGGLARFVAAQDRFARNQGNIVGQDLGRTPGFAVFSLNASWRPIGRVELTVGVDNLLDRAYAEHLSRGGSAVAGYPAPATRVNEPGRNGWVSCGFSW